MKYASKLICAAFSAGLIASGASAATVTIQDVGGTVAYASITYAGTDSDILGWYDNAWNLTLAEWFPGGNNPYESDLVGDIIGDPNLNLGGTELTISGQSVTVPGNTYFTAKFNQSLAVFHNTSDSAIEFTFALDPDCRDVGAANECGALSHSKHVSDGSNNNNNNPPVVPLPAAGWLLIGALGGLAAFRRKKTA